MAFGSAVISAAVSGGANITTSAHCVLAARVATTRVSALRKYSCLQAARLSAELGRLDRHVRTTVRQLPMHCAKETSQTLRPRGHAGAAVSTSLRSSELAPRGMQKRQYIDCKLQCKPKEAPRPRSRRSKSYGHARRTRQRTVVAEHWVPLEALL